MLKSLLPDELSPRSSVVVRHLFEIASVFRLVAGGRKIMKTIY